MERSSRQAVTFARPFRLDAIGWELPPGTYDIDTHEELLPGLSFAAYRRILTTITLEDPATLMRQVTEINPDDLAAALRKDLEESNG